MDLLINQDDYFKYLESAVQQSPTRVRIASYGMYIGISADSRDHSKRYKSRTRDLLESMRKIKNVEIVTGLYEYTSCKNKIACLDCEKKYALGLFRLLNHVDTFPEFKWKITTGMHVKYVLFEYAKLPKKGVTGSRNFTDSAWDDVSVTLNNDGITKFESIADDIWERSMPLDVKSVENVLLRNEISEKAVASIA